MTCTMWTIYGEIPFTMYLIIRIKLSALAEDEWKRIKPTLKLWKRLTGKQDFVEEYIQHYLKIEWHPTITRG